MIVEIKEWSIPNENEQETGVIYYMINSPSEMKSLASDFISPNADLPSLTE